MKFNLSDTTEFNSIQSYDDTGISISTAQSLANPSNPPERFSHSVFICATQVAPDFPVSNIKNLSVSDCQSVFNLNETLQLDVLLIGCNAKPAILPSELHQAFTERRIGVECMSIGAACRTYNMLLNESRSVGVLFLM